jgi:Protein of unknown function (DUF4232)
MAKMDEGRIQEGLRQLMSHEPPPLDSESARSRGRMGAVGIGAGTFVLLFLVLGGAFILDHQSGNDTPSTPGAASSSHPSPEPSPSATLSPAVTPSPSGFLPALGPMCRSSQLRVRVGIQGGAGGNGITYLVFTDHGAGSCKLDGTPTVRFLNAHGGILSTVRVVDASGGYVPTFANNGVGLLPLADAGSPGSNGVRGQAALPLQYRDGACPSAVRQVQVVLTTGIITTPVAISGLQSPDCTPLSVVVNPFQPADWSP